MTDQPGCTQLPTFVQLRQRFGFGTKRLKIWLALNRETQIDSDGWHGTFSADVGPTGQVKAHAIPAKREVTIDE